MKVLSSITLALTLLIGFFFQQWLPGSIALNVSQLPPANRSNNRIYIIADGISESDCSVGGGTFTVLCKSNGSVWSSQTVRSTAVGGGESIPSGVIVYSLTAPCPNGFTEETSLANRIILNTIAAAGNVGTTGGSDNITPAGTNGTVSFIPQGTNGSVNYTPSGTISALTFTGNPFTALINHTHNVSITDPGHTHVITSQTATTGSITSYEHGPVDTSSAEAGEGELTSSGTTGITATTANPAGGVSSITPTGSINTPNFTGTQGTVPAQIFTGIQGTIPAQTFTGTQFDNRSAFVRLIPCKKD